MRINFSLWSLKELRSKGFIIKVEVLCCDKKWMKTHKILFFALHCWAVPIFSYSSDRWNGTHWMITSNRFDEERHICPNLSPSPPPLWMYIFSGKTKHLKIDAKGRHLGTWPDRVFFSCPGQLNNWHCRSVGLSEPTNNQSLGSIK